MLYRNHDTCRIGATAIAQPMSLSGRMITYETCMFDMRTGCLLTSEDRGGSAIGSSSPWENLDGANHHGRTIHHQKRQA